LLEIEELHKKYDGDIQAAKKELTYLLLMKMQSWISDVSEMIDIVVKVHIADNWHELILARDADIFDRVDEI